MEHLCDSIVAFVRDKSAADPSWVHLEVVVSTHRVSGEGEQKILADIRKRTSTSACQTYCVFSPDSDLVPMLVQTRGTYFCLMREWTLWTATNEFIGNGTISRMVSSEFDFELIYINLIREYLALDFSGHVDGVFDDFAAMIFLLGNDFLPPFPDLKIGRGDFEKVMSVYREFRLSGRFLVRGNRLVSDFFCDFVRQVLARLNGSVSCVEHSDDLKRECCAVLDTFDWVLDYSAGRCPSYSYFFPHLKCPPLAAVIDYLPEHKPVIFVDDFPLRPFEFLMSVLTPGSSVVLPRALVEVMGELPELYPDNPPHVSFPPYPNDLYGDVPFVDLERVREGIKRAPLGPAELLRDDAAEPICIPGRPRTSPTSSGYFPVFGPHCPEVETHIQSQVIEVFHRRSKYESMVLGVNTRLPVSDCEERVVLVDYPFWKPAYVTEQVTHADPSEIDFYLRQWGLQISKESPCVKCELIVFSSTDRNYLATIHEPVTIPICLVREIDGSFEEPLRGLYVPERCWEPPSGKVVVRAGEYAGRIGELVSENVVNVKDYKHPKSSRFAKAERSDGENWASLEALARHFGVSDDVMRKVLQSWTVAGKEIGFTVCPPGHFLDGWCRRKKDGTFVFARQIIRELEQYFEHGNALLDSLKRLSRMSCILPLTVRDLFPGGERALDAFVEWIRRDTILARFALLDSEFINFSQGALEQMERELEEFRPVETELGCARIAPEDLVWAGRPVEGDAPMWPGRRAVVVLAAGSCPFGTFGTIVGGCAARREIEFVCDVEQRLGSYLRGRLRTRRGFTLKKGDVFLLPDGQ
jgi:hypothetical protein